MFYEVAQSYSSPLKKFHPYAVITERDAFLSLNPRWKEESRKLAESFAGYSFPNMLATDFLDFSRTGNRVRYEDKFFKKRLVLNALVMAECIEDQGRFLDEIVNGIFSICEESAWQLPPHNSYENTPQLPLPDSTEPVLDLFACETGAVLATAAFLLKDRLDKISPFITKRIRAELEHRIYKPYINRHFWWMGNGVDPMCNWTIWCTQNVLLSAFLNEEMDADAAHKIFLKACQSTDYFLADYGEDGCCNEGAQYYRHAGLCLFNTLEVLNGITDGAFQNLYENEKIKNIAAYIFNVHVHDKYYINFADCSPVAGRSGVREYLFAKRTGNENMRLFAASDFVAGGLDTLLLPNENNLYYRLQNAFTINEIMDYYSSFRTGNKERNDNKGLGNPTPQNIENAIPSSSIKKIEILHKDIYYPSVGLFLVRDNSLTLAVKAGNNGDSHNHNDTGSFTIYKNGEPFFIDLGVESYTKKTFSDRRYEIWTMQSAYHNLPTINGLMQKDGKDYGAQVLSWELDSETPYIEMDIAGAYPFGEETEPVYLDVSATKEISEDITGSRTENRASAAGAASAHTQNALSANRNEDLRDCATEMETGFSYLRKATLIKNREIVLEDRFSSGCKNVILNFITYEKPVLKNQSGGGSACDELFLDIGELGCFSIQGAILLKIEAIPIDDARLGIAWKHEVYRIRACATSPFVKMRIH